MRMHHQKRESMLKKIKSALRLNQPPELTTIFAPQNPDYLTDYEMAFHSPPVSYADKYPEVPKPKLLTEPELLAARWASGEIYPEKMPGIAADLLEAGLDSPSLCRLAGEMNVQCIADVQEIVERMFRELGITLPGSDADAKMLSTRQIAREAITGTLNPWKAASEMHRIWSYEIWHRENLADVAQLLEELDCATIARGGLPKLTADLIEVFARLGALTGGEKRMASLGCLEGKGWIADDFDAPLPDELLAQFEGRDDPDW
jgi:hypothetical protein